MNHSFRVGNRNALVKNVLVVACNYYCAVGRNVLLAVCFRIKLELKKLVEDRHKQLVAELSVLGILLFSFHYFTPYSFSNSFLTVS